MTSSSRPFRQTVEWAHRYLGLGLAALWMLQALTGALLVFHWELDDWQVRGPARPLDPVAFAASLAAIPARPHGGTVSAVYGSAGLPGRFDVLVRQAEGRTDVLRLDGGGAVLRARPSNYDPAHMGVFQSATYLHQTLFAHQAGSWAIGASGAILILNVAAGLKLAWPLAGRWEAALRPRLKGPAPARWRGLHRAAGLWLAAPALILFSAGALLAFDTPLAGWFDNARPPPLAALAPAEPAARPQSFATAVSAALARHPGAALWGVEMPDADTPWFKVELRQPGDLRRFAGVTAVYVSNRSGRIMADYDVHERPLRTVVWDALYAIHTGEAGGVIGRVLAAIVGIWLLSLCILGMGLWAARRRPPRRPIHKETA